MAFLTLQVAWNLCVIRDNILSPPPTWKKKTHYFSHVRNHGIGVDVHVHRITNLLGWHKPPTKNPEQTRYYSLFLINFSLCYLIFTFFFNRLLWLDSISNRGFQKNFMVKSTIFWSDLGRWVLTVVERGDMKLIRNTRCLIKGHMPACQSTM